MDSSKSITDDVLAVLARAQERGIYGSIEIYFEKGKITQITERVIKKVHQATPAHSHRITPPKNSTKK